MTKNIVALQNGLAIIPTDRKIMPASEANEHSKLAASIQAELMNLGFMLNKDAFHAAELAPREWLLSFHNEALGHLRKALGAHRNFRPFYGNFPTQVMEMSDIELFVNAFVHYLSDGKWEPNKKLKERGISFENTEFKIIKLGNENDFRNIFTRLVSVNSSLTDADKLTVAWFVDTYKAEGLSVPEVIPFKETLCILAAKGLNVKVKQATDVLRVAVYLSGGDISLPSIPKVTVKEVHPGWRQWFFESLKTAQEQARESFKFKKFTRAERRQILGLLEKTTLDVSEMQGRLGRWLRLGEVLHPGEYAAKFPKTHAAFRDLRNQSKFEKIRTFHGRVDLAFAKDWRSGVALLAERPGEFARKLDWMVRTFEPTPVLNQFAEIGDKISSKVLFELYNHFDARTKPEAVRSIMLKGNQSKMQVLEPLAPLSEGLAERIKATIFGILQEKISGLPSLGKVWIDPKLKDVPVPFAMRSVNSAVKTYVRGTRIPFRADAKVVRPFIHWFDDNGSVDLDLSVGFYSETLQSLGAISFHNLRNHDLNCTHSGDIRHRQGACAEYVDVDIQRCLSKGVRYAMVQVNNYDGRPLHAVKDCVFGLMEREKPVANEIFVPKTITNCMGIANESSTVNICMLDLQEKNYIWMDMETAGNFAMYESVADKTLDMIKSLLGTPKISVYDLLKLHADARGSHVPSLLGGMFIADLKFRWEDFVTDYSKVAMFMTF